jgi:iron(II)-dependent oxidoreductase
MAHADFPPPTPDALASWVQDARRRTLALITDLTDQQLLGPQLSIVNPPLWEIGHLAWFWEKWVLRHANGRPSRRTDADALYDSAAVAHDTRWDLSLPSRAQTLRYLAEVEEQVLGRLADRPRADEVYFTLLSVFHEDMHAEALTYTRQTLAYPAPHWPDTSEGGSVDEEASWGGDVSVAGGTFRLGAEPGESFVFDNEKWAHPVELRPFAIARAPVTQAEFAAFVEDGGYRRRDLWGPEGW